jgi:hypothetical protein
MEQLRHVVTSSILIVKHSLFEFLQEREIKGKFRLTLETNIIEKGKLLSATSDVHHSRATEN